MSTIYTLHIIMCLLPIPAKKGRASEGLARCYQVISNTFVNCLFHSSDWHYGPLRLGHLVFININLPCDQKRLVSLIKFSNVCSSLINFVIQY